MTLSVRDSGIWKTASSISVKDGGVWKTAVQAWVFDAGTWKPFFVAVTLTATASPTTLSNSGSYNSGFLVTATCTAIPANGTGPYTYLWSRVSGSTGVKIGDNKGQSDTSTASAVTFTALPYGAYTASAVFQCVVTDTSTGQTATTNNVNVTIQYTS